MPPQRALLVVTVLQVSAACSAQSFVRVVYSAASGDPNSDAAFTAMRSTEDHSVLHHFLGQISRHSDDLPR